MVVIEPPYPNKTTLSKDKMLLCKQIASDSLIALHIPAGSQLIGTAITSQSQSSILPINSSTNSNGPKLVIFSSDNYNIKCHYY